MALRHGVLDAVTTLTELRRQQRQQRDDAQRDQQGD
jgi:hypothetical protein